MSGIITGLDNIITLGYGPTLLTTVPYITAVRTAAAQQLLEDLDLDTIWESDDDTNSLPARAGQQSILVWSLRHFPPEDHPELGLYESCVLGVSLIVRTPTSPPPRKTAKDILDLLESQVINSLHQRFAWVDRANILLGDNTVIEYLEWSDTVGPFPLPPSYFQSKSNHPDPAGFMYRVLFSGGKRARTLTQVRP